MIQGVLLLKAGKEKMGCTGWLCLQALGLLSGRSLGSPQCSHCSAVEGTHGNVSWADSCGLVYPRGHYFTGHPPSLTTADHVIPQVGKEKKG